MEQIQTYHQCLDKIMKWVLTKYKLPNKDKNLLFMDNNEHFYIGKYEGDLFFYTQNKVGIDVNKIKCWIYFKDIERPN